MKNKDSIHSYLILDLLAEREQDAKMLDRLYYTHSLARMSEE